MSHPQTKPDSSSAAPSGPHPQGPGGFFKKKSIGSLVVVVALAAYAFFQPRLNDRYGWNLPGLADQSSRSQNGDVSPNESWKGSAADSSDKPAADSTFTTVTSPPSKTSGKKTKLDKEGTKTSSSGQSETRKPGPLAGRKKSSPAEPEKPKPGPLADRMKSNSAQNSSAPTRGPPSGTSRAGSSNDEDGLKYGLLREIQSDRFMSPEGLLYTPGSAEGHRLEHLRRHTKDMPSRAGSHGVFDGGMEGALETIDKAYARAKKKQRTTKQVDKGRTIYTVDMGGRVGFVGGRTGNQRRKPMARRVKLILEGTRVITAYPL